MPEENERDAHEFSVTDLLKVIREISSHSDSEVNRVVRMYKIAAFCITVLFAVGIFFTYKDTAEFRKESRNEIEKQRELLSDEVERQEKRMRERQEALFLQMQTQLSQQVAVLGQKVESRVEDEFRKENITRLVSDKAQERIDFIADPLIEKKIQPKIDDVNNSLQQAKNELQTARDDLKKVQDTADFLSIVSKAQNDDRQSFEQLKSWALDPTSFWQADAHNAYRQIIDEESSLLTSTYDVPWKEGTDLSKYSFEELRAGLFYGSNVYTKMALLKYIWERIDFTKKQKMGLMIDVMKSDGSLKVVAAASRLFQKGSKQPTTKALAVDEMFAWWERNGDTISDKPEGDAQQK